MAGDTSWIDHIPGARAAYSYLEQHATTFFAIGPALQRQLATLDHVWATLPPPPRSSAQLATLNQWVMLRNETIADYDDWARVEPAIRAIWNGVQTISQTKALPGTPPPSLPSLGAVLWWVPIAVELAKWGALAIGAVVIVNQILGKFTTREGRVQQIVSDAVAQGLISPTDSVQIIRDGKPTAGEDLLSMLKWGGIALAGIMALQLIVPPPRGRRR